MRPSRFAAGGVALVVAAMVAAGCSDSTVAINTSTTAFVATTVPSRGNVDGVLELGVLLPTSGDNATVGPPMIDAVKMAQRDINQANGVDIPGPQDVKLTIADEGSDAATASANAGHLVNVNKVDAIIGPASSSIALSVLGRITGAGVLDCSPANTALSLERFPDNGYYFRTPPSDRLEAMALAKVVVAGGYKRVALVSPADDYGRGMADLVAAELERDVVKVVIDQTYDPRGTSFDTEAENVAKADPDAIALIGLPDTGSLVLRSLNLARLSPRTTPTFVSDGMHVPNLYQRIDPSNPKVTDGLKGVAPAAVPIVSGSGFTDSFKRFAAEPPSFSAYAYDCAVIVALAAEMAKTDDPAIIRQKITEVTHGDVVCHSFSTCKALVESGRKIEYQGAAGALRLTELGDPSQGRYDEFTYDQDGKDTVTDQFAVALPGTP